MVTFDDLLGLGLSPRTAYLYARTLDRVVPLLAAAGADLATATPAQVAVAAETLGGSHARRQMLRSALVAAWTVLGRLDGPARAVRVPPRPRGRCRALAPEAAQRLEEAAWALRESPCGLAVLIGLYGALRRSEIASLRWEDVLSDADGYPEGLKVRGKGGVEAAIPLHPVLAGLLAAQRRSSGWVFPGRRPGQPVGPSTVWSWTRLVASQAGLEVVPTHVLRHTALAESNDRTGDLRAVQEFARHARPETTALYTRVAWQRLSGVVSAISYGRSV